jgi:microcystin degradation protein MlrC
MPALRAFTAGLGVETNTLSPLYVDIEAFARTFLFRPGTHPDALTEVSAPLYVLRQRRQSLGWEVVEGTYAFALPAGRVGRAAYEDLRDEILAQLRAGGRYDFVALSMHGAMCAVGYDDCEGDLLARVRAVVGPGTPIGVELDPHAHLSAEMLRHADVLIAFKEYPHTDFLERGVELIDLLERCARIGWRPARALFDCRTIGRFHTTREPMKTFVHDMTQAQRRPGVASVSLIHGFPWGDVPDMGAKCLVLADDIAVARQTAEEFGQRLMTLRELTFTPPAPLEQALDTALSYEETPVVLADIADNPGGGAPGDATHLLRLLLQRPGISACVGPFWDPAVVRIAHAVGVDGRCELRLGGKCGAGSGLPLDLDVEVTGLAQEAFQSWAGTRMSLGRACALRVGAIDIMVSSVRDQAYSPDLFAAVGIDPAAHRLVVVKSAQHFVAGFAALAQKYVLASGGGPLETDFRKIPYRHVRRPIWPLDAQQAPGAITVQIPGEVPGDAPDRPPRGGSGAASHGESFEHGDD